jgi:hypothetical protein
MRVLRHELLWRKLLRRKLMPRELLWRDLLRRKPVGARSCKYDWKSYREFARLL